MADDLLLFLSLYRIKRCLHICTLRRGTAASALRDSLHKLTIFTTPRIFSECDFVDAILNEIVLSATSGHFEPTGGNEGFLGEVH